VEPPTTLRAVRSWDEALPQRGEEEGVLEAMLLSAGARGYEKATVQEVLDRAGISTSDISIVASNADGWYDENAREPGRIDTDGDGVDDRTEGAATGAGIGGAVGGIAGLLAGLGLMAIPGLGPVVAAGWLVSTAALAVIDFPLDDWSKLHPKAGRLDRFVIPRALDTETA